MKLKKRIAAMSAAVVTLPLLRKFLKFPKMYEDTILSTGANGALALGTQQRHQVGILRPRLFLRRKIDKFSHSFSPYGSMWSLLPPEGRCGTISLRDIL